MNDFAKPWWLHAPVTLAFALSAALYPSLPQRFATHWNAQGVADGFSTKPWGAFMLPAVILGLHALLLLWPRVSSRGSDSYGTGYLLLGSATETLLCVLHAIVLLAAVRETVAPTRLMVPLLGLFFIAFGNFSGKLRRNGLIGIRTPWTLADDEVWLRTHRFGGRVMMGAGVVTLLASPLPDQQGAVMIASVLTATLASTVYSYLVYRDLHRTA